MSDTTEQPVRQLEQTWAEAEQHGDTSMLQDITTDDFTLVGPAGFVLHKQQWLDRYRSGALVTHSLRWDDVEVHTHGDAAVTIGRHTQQAEYRGHRADGEFRATHVAVRSTRGWLLAGMALSPIGGPPPFAAREGGSTHG